MLEKLLIFTRGGLILWTCKELGNALKGSPIDTLMWSCLLEEWFGAASYNYDAAGAAYTLKGTFHNELGLVFVAVYQRILHLLYVDDLLAMVKREFLEMYDPKRTAYSDFDETFRRLKKEAEARKPLDNSKKQGQMQNARFHGVSNKKSESTSPSDGGDGDNTKGHNLENGHSNGNYVHNEDSKVKGGANNIENGSSDAGAFDVNKLQKLRAKGGKKVETLTKLDFTDDVGENGDNIEVVAADHGESMMDKEEIFSSESEAEDDEEVGKDSKPETKKKGRFSTMFQRLYCGQSKSGEADLEPTLKALKDRLMTKNVAEEISERLCESVAASLEGKKIGFAAMEEALVRILTPRCSIDILRDVHAAREQRKAYVVVFVNVNGVGKSTNLTKIPIFEKGYEKDLAIVAKEAIQEVTHDGSDVVLVVIAGRMQDNEPLMRALSKLIYLNNPDLFLFVGEALVGNDAVDQLSKFNQKLADLSTSASPRLIDGILLTKVDTIDDKVGAALSMVYISGAPVKFVGCAQSHSNLKKLIWTNIRAVSEAKIYQRPFPRKTSFQLHVSPHG
ncbi:hypothetical protein CIPAW_16G110000 [Carya illinoinensis]|uniref:SRP54-type proteins GTP-binding domain-containing protein n=1 Tax=Carya illinoinensis TaxID=32201 RepID=A0A8T1N983_CARIL|nr:hypothetical protein CIPAW_16G110000 [Carya illinoinensis]